MKRKRLATMGRLSKQGNPFLKISLKSPQNPLTFCIAGVTIEV